MFSSVTVLVLRRWRGPPWGFPGQRRPGNQKSNMRHSSRHAAGFLTAFQSLSNLKGMPGSVPYEAQPIHGSPWRVMLAAGRPMPLMGLWIRPRERAEEKGAAPGPHSPILAVPMVTAGRPRPSSV